MFRLIKYIAVALLSVSMYLATKFMSLIYIPCMMRPIIVDLNHFDLN